MVAARRSDGHVSKTPGTKVFTLPLDPGAYAVSLNLHRRHLGKAEIGSWTHAHVKAPHQHGRKWEQ